MAKKDKKSEIKSKELDTSLENLSNDLYQKIKQLEEKQNEIIETIVQLPSMEKLNEVSLNYQSLKNEIEQNIKKINEIIQNMDNLYSNFSFIETNLSDIQQYRKEMESKYEELKALSSYFDEILKKLEFLDEFKNEYSSYKDKYLIIDHLVSRFSSLDEYIQNHSKLINEFTERLNTLEKEINHFMDKIDFRIEEKITEFFENYQAKVDEAQTLKIIEIEDKLTKLVNEYQLENKNIIEKIENKLSNQINENIIEKLDLIINKYKDLFPTKSQDIIDQVDSRIETKIEEYFLNVQTQIDSSQTQKIIELEEKLKELINQYHFESKNIVNEIKEIMNNQINESLVEKIDMIVNKYREIVYSDIADKISQIDQKVESMQIIDDLKSEIDIQQSKKIVELESKFSNELVSFRENIVNEIREIMNNQINESLVEKIDMIVNKYREIVYSDIADKISQIDQKVESMQIIDDLKNEIDIQQSKKIVELENKLNNEFNSLKESLITLVRENEQNSNNIFDKILKEITELKERDSFYDNIFKGLEQKYQDLNQKYLDFVSLINSTSEKIISLLYTSSEVENLEYSDSLPYDLNKLLEIMNRQDIMADYLFIKSGNRPMLKSSRTIAAVGKSILKNGDVLNFALSIFSPTEINQLKTQGYFENIKTIGNNKYYVTIQRIFDDYSLNIHRLSFAPSNISDFPIINPDKLISSISNLVLFLGVDPLKNSVLSAIVNYINHKQIKRIAIIEEKVSFLYKENQSIIDLFEFKGNQEKLEKLLKKVIDENYDLIVISAESMDKDIMKSILSYSYYRNFILNLSFDSIISFYKSYKDLSEELLKTLTVYITHKVAKNNLSIMEIIFVDNKIRGLIKSEDIKAIKEYIISIEETDCQTINESIGYLVKMGKLTKEEAVKYLSNPDELEVSSSYKQEQVEL